VQINFAEHNSDLYNRQEGSSHKYTLEYSENAEDWKILADKSENKTDNTHIYIPLSDTVFCRYLKITNIEVPGGNFALNGFRVFGEGQGDTPVSPEGFEQTRDQEDQRKVHLRWDKTAGADGYMINYGIDQDRLYHHYQVYKDTSLTISSLDAGQSYYFTIESFNGKGMSESSALYMIE
jgi:hypothetical protein